MKNDSKSNYCALILLVGPTSTAYMDGPLLDKKGFLNCIDSAKILSP